MYKSFTADDWRKHLGVPVDYRVRGFLVYGTYKKQPYTMLRESLERLGLDATFSHTEDEFLSPIQEFLIDGERYWFVVAYGGALLSEYLHLACMFGSQKNILLGSCGGLKRGALAREIVIPTWSYAEESSAKAYRPDAGNKYASDIDMSNRLDNTIGARYQVHRGPTVTYQAMMGETWNDVQNWSEQGYLGVEMEAATVFATSSHFNVPSSAVLLIGDNLIEEESVLDINYENSRDLRRKVAQDMFDVALSELVS